MSKIKAKPREGLNVRNPVSGSIITGEREFEKTPAIIRMLKYGDLIEIKEFTKKKITKKTVSKKKTTPEPEEAK